MPARHRRLGALALGTALAVAAVATTASSASAGTPVTAFRAMVQGSSIAVSGTYTPLVGNFVGDANDDIFWYAPGPAADHLWEGTDTDGVFIKRTKSVNGTYTPLVGDFSGDDHDDILWYAPGIAADTLWTAVGGTALFQSSFPKITGRYQPIALDQRVEVARFALGITSSAPKDHIVWYAPGSAADWVWRFLSDGTYVSQRIDIVGSPQLIPVNRQRDDTQGFFAYQPGPGVDAIWEESAGEYIAKIPDSYQVNGTYTPYPAGPGYAEEMLWLGPGSPRDSRWSNVPPAGWQPAPVTPLNQSGPLLPLSSAAGAGYLYDATGPDVFYQQGTVSPITTTDQGPGARPFSGDFDGDHSLDVFFYRPGAGAEAIGYGNYLA